MGNIDLTMVHEVEHTLHVSECDAFQVEDQRALLVGRLVSSKDRPEEGATGAEDHFVGLKLLIVTSGDSDVKKLLLVPKMIIFKMLIIFNKWPQKQSMRSLINYQPLITLCL